MSKVPETNRLRIGAWIAGTAALLTLVVALALIGPWLAPEPLGRTVGRPFDASAGGWLGTGELGHDIWSEVLHGGRRIVLAPLVITAISTLVGTALGTVMAVSRTASRVLRLLDVIAVIPPLVVLLLLLYRFGVGTAVVGVSVVLLNAPYIARYMRSVAEPVLNFDYVLQARLVGEPRRVVIWRHVLPNLAGPVLADAALRIAGTVYVVAAASFLGFGHTTTGDGLGRDDQRRCAGSDPQPLGDRCPGRRHRRLHRAPEPARRSNRGTMEVGVTSADAPVGVAELRVRNLTVSVANSGRRILDQVDLTVGSGTVMGVVGESGSGKTTLVRSLLGAVTPGLIVDGDVDLISGDESVPLLSASRRVLRSMRARRIAYLNQDPALSLTPTMRIGPAVAERLPAGSDRRGEAVESLFRSVGLPDDDEFLRRYPFAVSGGQVQRVALARALACSPDLLLLDEPTTGLDVVTQVDLLDELARQQRRSPRTTVIVSHDLAVVARLADDLVVLRDGQIVERGPCRATLRRPEHPYTAELVAASPDPDHRRGREGAEATPAVSSGSDQFDSGAAHQAPRLAIAALGATHRRRRRTPVIAADGLDLEIEPSACVALVGASGSGKSTIARAIVGAHIPDAGAVVLDGHALPPALDDRSARDRWKVQLIPQDPASSLDPRRRAGQAVGDVVRRCGRANGKERVDEVVAALLTDVGLDPALADRRPGELSGGERQRVAIARALAASPTVLICDEVTSSLDVSVQSGVLSLLRSLVDDHGMAMLFITHDLGLVRDVADRVTVLHEGRVCEAGPVDAVLQSPAHEVTSRLLAASLSLSAELGRSPASGEEQVGRPHRNH